MRRSALVLLITVLVGMFLTPVPAAAAGANFAKPDGGHVVTSGSLVPVEVRVDKSASDPAVNSVQVQLFRDGSSYSRTSLRCASDGCTSSPQTWVGAFDPQPTPIRNGAWNLQLKVNEGSFQDRITIYLSLPPSAVKDLQASPQEGGVRVTWTRAPEPDISGYRIVRIKNGQSQVLKTLGADARSYTDQPPASGEYTYQVISIRPSGTSSGGERTSTPASTKASVSDTSQDKNAPPKPEAPAQGGNADAGGTSGGGGTTVGQNPPGGSPAAGASGSGAAPNARRGPLAAHVPPPPPARRGSGFSLRSLARVFGYEQPPGEGEGAGEEYFGEGEGFSEELDYSGIDPLTGEPIAVPVEDSGGRGMLISDLTDRPLLLWVAAGLLLLALALYILRWIRRSPRPHTAGPDQTPPAWEATTTSPTARDRFFKARGPSATSAARVPSPTTAPLSPRASEQPQPVNSQDAGATKERTPATSPAERSRKRAPAPTPPVFAADAKRRVSRHEAREGGALLFPQRRSSETPTSGRDQSEYGNGTETVKVLRPPSSKDTGRKVR